MEEKGLEWISVKDRMPELYMSVVVLIDNGVSRLAETSYLGRTALADKRWAGRFGSGEITHWMPIPKPPEPPKLEPACKFMAGDLVYYIDQYAKCLCAGIVTSQAWRGDHSTFEIMLNRENLFLQEDLYKSREEAERAIRND